MVTNPLPLLIHTLCNMISQLFPLRVLHHFFLHPLNLHWSCDLLMVDEIFANTVQAETWKELAYCVSFSIYALGLFHLTCGQAQAFWKIRDHRTCLQSFQLFKTWPSPTNQPQPAHLLAADAWMSPAKISWAPSSPEEQLSHTQFTAPTTISG